MTTLNARLPHASRRVMELNRQHFDPPLDLQLPASTLKRIRQTERKIPETEIRFKAWIDAAHPGAEVYPQFPLPLKEKNCTLFIDFLVVDVGVPDEGFFAKAYEVKARRKNKAKGRSHVHAEDDAIVKLKWAAAKFTWISIFLAAEDDLGAWQFQLIMK